MGARSSTRNPGNMVSPNRVSPDPPLSTRASTLASTITIDGSLQVRACRKVDEINENGDGHEHNLQPGYPAQQCGGSSTLPSGSCRERLVGQLRRVRIEQAAIAQLNSMSARALHDIGVARSQIEVSVKGIVDLERGRSVSLKY